MQREDVTDGPEWHGAGEEASGRRDGSSCSGSSLAQTTVDLELRCAPQLDSWPSEAQR